MESEQLDLSSLLNAVSRLEEAFKEPPANELERDGCIQRFEYTKEPVQDHFKLVFRSLLRPCFAGK
jgi:hypothetical protein